MCHIAHFVTHIRYEALHHIKGILKTYSCDEIGMFGIEKLLALKTKRTRL